MNRAIFFVLSFAPVRDWALQLVIIILSMDRATRRQRLVVTHAHKYVVALDTSARCEIDSIAMWNRIQFRICLARMRKNPMPLN